MTVTTGLVPAISIKAAGWAQAVLSPFQHNVPPEHRGESRHMGLGSGNLLYKTGVACVLRDHFRTKYGVPSKADCGGTAYRPR